MFVNWKNKTLNLYNDNGSIVRKITTRYDIVDAVIQGNGAMMTIAISFKDGHTELYKSNGQLLRRI